LWFPLNYLVATALERYHNSSATNDCRIPDRSGTSVTLDVRRRRFLGSGPGRESLPVVASVTRRRRLPSVDHGRIHETQDALPEIGDDDIEREAVPDPSVSTVSSSPRILVALQCGATR